MGIKRGAGQSLSEKNKHSFIREALNKRVQEHRFRTLKTVNPQENSIQLSLAGKHFINFSGNDYLGLSSHPEVKTRTKDFTEKYGAGSAASRLITGNLSIHEELEEKLARVFGYEAGLVFNSGFQANVGILSSIADRHSLIIADKKVHNSLIQGAKLSGAEFKRFNHNDLGHLEKLILETKQKDYNRIWVVTETVFSMDGDVSDIDAFSKMCDKHEVLLYSDDAHAIGVFGDKGLGLNPGIAGIDISIGTFGKSFGAFGAFVGCSKEMKEYLINYCPAFIYTTSLPPSVIGAIDSALDLIPEMNDDRNHIFELGDHLRSELEHLGISTGNSKSQIIPIIIGDEQECLQLSEYLAEHGILATAIRPPTVAVGESRIRITISSVHTMDQVNQLIELIKAWKQR